MSKKRPLTHTEVSNILVYLIFMPIILAMIFIYAYYQYIKITIEYVGPWVLFISAYIISGAIFYLVESKRLSKYR